MSFVSPGHSTLGIGLSDMGSSANVWSNLTKTPNQGGSAHQSAFEVRVKFKQFLLVRLDLCFGRMKDCNVRLIYNIELSWMLSWKHVLQSV